MGERGASDFSKIFSPILADLLRVEKVRGRIQERVNKAIAHCRKSVSSTHRGDFAVSEAELERAKAELSKIARLSENSPQLLGWNLVNSAYQEYVEAALLLCVGKGAGMPSPKKLSAPPTAFLLGAADLVGELRRMVVNAIRSGETSEAEELYHRMVEMFEHISRFPLSDSMVPGLRRKVDQARYMLEETNALLAEERGRRELMRQMEETRRFMESKKPSR
ncbi:MAG: hypothetical protein JTT11_01245 [Candidatus Brockarchaeota archaeon]|nr:hypothetical protein [Candidatus Brockarchaeota archaeon]